MNKMIRILIEFGLIFGIFSTSLTANINWEFDHTPIEHQRMSEGATKLAKRAGITEYSKVASGAKNLLGKEKRAILLKALGRGVVSEDELVDRGLLKKLMYFIKDDSNDILSGAHEMKFAVDSGIDEVMPFGDGNLKRLIVLKEGTHYGTHRGWGFRHIVKEHLEDFKRAFGIEDESELLELLRNIIKDGKVTDISRDAISGWDITFEYGGKKVYVVISGNDKGIITAHPLKR